MISGVLKPAIGVPVDYHKAAAMVNGGQHDPEVHEGSAWPEEVRAP